jgi:hypothetical protein
VNPGRAVRKVRYLAGGPALIWEDETLCCARTARDPMILGRGTLSYTGPASFASGIFRASLYFRSEIGVLALADSAKPVGPRKAYHESSSGES